MLSTTCNLELSDLLDVNKSYLRDSNQPHICLTCGLPIGFHKNKSFPSIINSIAQHMSSSTSEFINNTSSNDISQQLLILEDAEDFNFHPTTSCTTSSTPQCFIEDDATPQYLIDAGKQFQLFTGALYCSQIINNNDDFMMMESKSPSIIIKKENPFPPFTQIITNINTFELQMYPASKAQALYKIKERSQTVLKVNCVNSNTAGVYCPFVIRARRQNESKRHKSLQNQSLFAKITSLNLCHRCQSTRFIESLQQQQQSSLPHSSNTSGIIKSSEIIYYIKTQ